MTIVHKGLINETHELEIDEDVDFSTRSFDGFYPLLGIKKCRCVGCFYRDEDDYLRCEMDVKAIVSLADSYDCEPFDYEVISSSDFEIMDKEDGEGEGYIFPGTSFSLDDLALCLIKTELPIAPRRKDSKLPEGKDYYSVF